MTDVLISASELADLTSKEPCVIIDTRNPDAYAAGHLPNAVNVHEIFTYLATSTPEGMQELKTKFADAFGKAGLSGKETAVIYEQSMNSGFGQSCRGYYLLDHARLSQGQGAARRLRRLGRRGPAGYDRRAQAGSGFLRHHSRSRRYPDRRQDHAGGGRQARHRAARRARCR